MLKIAWSKVYAHSLPVEHRFPMEKYELIPTQLLYEGIITENNLFTPAYLEEKHILATHDANYWDKLKNLELSPAEIRKTGFPLSQALIQREIIIAQGTLDCALYALEYGVAMNVAGGTHHAFTDRGEGFCLLNDLAIAANFLLENKLASKILIVDLDVHQGNGTAQIFAHQPHVFTFSMHGEKNYPLHKEKSDLDIGLPDGIDDKTYLSQLNKNLFSLIEQQMPDFIFFQAGVDVLATDKLGRLGLTIQGCKERDKLIIQTCKTYKIPLVITMGGGYSPKIATILEAHTNTFKLAQEIYF